MEKDLYFKQNKEVLGLLDFINNYVKQVLEEENKENLEEEDKEKFEKEDFNLMKGYVENLVEYKKVIDRTIFYNVKIEIVEKIIFGQTLEEFKDFFIYNDKVVSLIRDGREENFKQLFKLKGFNKEMLIELADNEEVTNLIENLEEENLNKVWELFKIKTKDDLIELAKNKEVIHLIKSIDVEKLNKVWELFKIKTKDDLIELAKNKEVINYIIRLENESLIEINAIDELKKLAEKFEL